MTIPVNIHISPSRLETFAYTEHKAQDMENDIDPENNLLNNINNSCNYFTEEQFNVTCQSEENISIIHFNSRSLYANFLNIKEYLSQFKNPFNIIAISEIWISAEKGVDFEMDGYELNYTNRRNKSGGGVAIYVDKGMNYKVAESMTTAVDDLFECVTVEICMEKSKNVIVSCIYRAPGTCIDTFTDRVENMFTKSLQKIMFICGDYNIDLLNPNKHKMTEHFINTLYSMGLYPKITRPSRITSHSATVHQ